MPAMIYAIAYSSSDVASLVYAFSSSVGPAAFQREIQTATCNFSQNHDKCSCNRHVTILFQCLMYNLINPFNDSLRQVNLNSDTHDACLRAVLRLRHMTNLPGRTKKNWLVDKAGLLSDSCMLDKKHVIR